MKKFLVLFLLVVECFAIDTGWSGLIRNDTDLNTEIQDMFLIQYRTLCNSQFKDGIFLPTFVVSEEEVIHDGTQRNISYSVTLNSKTPELKDFDNTTFNVNVVLDEYTGEYQATIESLEGLCGSALRFSKL